MIACTACGQENPEGFKFCGGCGASLEAPATVECPSCGQENPAGFKFCGACGADLAVAPEPAPEEERKVVTALFTDIVGSTARAESLDPEDVRAMLAPYYSRLRTELERYGGTVEKFIGDAVVALFGAPVAHEDDPERAVRAALAINEAVRDLNEAEEWLDLHIRTAVHTGEALVVVGARAVEGEGMAAGDVMNTAARLQGGAPVDGIAVGEATYRATQHVIEYVEGEAVAAKGKSEPIPIWVVVGEKAHVERPDGGTRLVGRRAELTRLTELWRAAQEARRPRLVTVLGPPGMGKSRLLLALCEHVEENASVHWGRCLSYGEGMTYWPVTEIVKSAAGIRHDDDPHTDAEKLGRLLEGLPTDDESELRVMATALAHLVGAVATPRGTYSAEEIGQAELHWGIRRVFELLSQQHPLLLILEDLHWAEPALLELLLSVPLEKPEAPILIAASARRELAETSPDFVAEVDGRTSVSLAPLAEVESEELLGELLAETRLEGDDLEKLLRNAGGNPLFLEETVRMVSQATQEGGGVALESLPVPENLQSLIGSRLDGLAAAEKRVVQQASVVGAVFWPAAVAHISGQNGALQPALETLERRDFVQARGESTIDSEREYAFKHILIRDVAYERLPKGRRAELHVRFVDWLTELGSGEELVEIEAYHLEQACLHARSVARSPIEAPVVQAAEALKRSAEKAERREGMREADRFYTRALELVGDDHPELGAELRLGRATAISALGNLRAACELAEQAAEDGLRLGRSDIRCAALLALANIEQRQGRAADARPRLIEAQALASELADQRLEIRAIFETANLRAWFDGEAQSAADDFRRALLLTENVDDRALRIQAHMRLGSHLFNMGELTEAGDALSAAVELAGEAGSFRDEARATSLLAYVEYFRDLEHAEALALRALDWLERVGSSYLELQNLRVLAKCALARGDASLAEERLRQAIPLALESGGWVVIEIYRYLVEALVEQGRFDDAQELFNFANRNLPEEDPYARAAVRLAEAIAASAAGERDRALEASAQALGVLEQQQLVIDLGEARLTRARALRRLNDVGPATTELELARATFAEMGASRLVAEIERELAELSAGARLAGSGADGTTRS